MQQAGTSGYLFAKHAAGSPRLYSGFISSNNNEYFEFVFLYTVVGTFLSPPPSSPRLPGPSAPGVTATARFQLPADKARTLSDGSVQLHDLLVTVGDGHVTVQIDGFEASPPSQRLVGGASALIKDCTPTLSSPPTSGTDDTACTLSVGAATGDSFKFAGTLFGAWLFPNSALSTFPEMKLEERDTADGADGAVVTPPVTTTMPMATTTSTTATTAPATTASAAADATAATTTTDTEATTTDARLATTTTGAQCSPGNFETAGVSTSTALLGIRLCVPCPAGYTDHDADPTSPCSNCDRRGGSGAYVPEGSVGTCETARVPCPSGTTDHDKTLSTPCARCAPGAHVASTGMQGSCRPFRCKTGTTDHDSDSSTPCMACTGVKGAFAPPGSSGPCELLMCEAGLVDADGDAATPCVTCDGALEYQDLVGQQACKTVTFCKLGEEQTVAPTETSDRVCTSCAPRVTFNDDPFNEAGCRPVTPPCDLEASFETAAPTASSDRACQLTTSTTTTTTTTTQHARCTITLTPRGGEAADASITAGVAASGFYETAPPSNTTDRECAPITECNAGAEYETTAPTLVQSGYPDEASQLLHATSDRECAPLTVCKPGKEYETIAASYNSDRACTALRKPCRATTEFEAVTPDATTDRVCQGVAAECRVGEYERMAPTATSNRECEACGPGSIDDDRDPTTPCVFCQGGTYQSTAGATVCIDSTHVCPAGTKEVEAPGENRASARVCRQCNGVTEFQNLAGQATCTAVSECAAGTYIAAEQTTSTDRSCIQCDGVTEYQDKAMQSFCLPMRSVCGSGFYESVSGTPVSDRVCSLCEAGVTYQDRLGQTECLSVSACKAGSATLRAPTLTQNRICLECDGVVHYQDEEGADVCKPVTHCGAETHRYTAVAATATSDAQCAALTNCTNGEFQAGFDAVSGDRSCSPHSPCKQDEYEYQAPTPTSDRLCASKTECRQNHFEVVAADLTDGINDEGSGDNEELLLGGGAALTDRVCEKCGRCSSVGEYEKRACGGVHDTECAVCRKCSDGETYQASPCSQTADAVCAPCSPCGGSAVSTSFGKLYVGTFAASACTAVQDTICRTCTQCNSYEFEVAQCTRATDTVCQLKCGYTVQTSASTFTKNNSTAAPVWNGELFTDINGLCKLPALCGAGEWEAAAPTPDTDRVCYPWSVCVPSYRSVDDGSADLDVVIFSGDDDGSGGEAEEDGTHRGASYEVVAPTSLADRQCKPATQCTTDEFETVAPTLISDRVCKALTVCSVESEYATIAATLTSDRVCRQRPGCTADEMVVESMGSDGLGVVWTCTQLANVTALQAQRSAAIGKASGYVIGFAAIVLIIAFLLIGANSPGSFVVWSRKGADDLDYFDLDAQTFWFRFEKRIEILPGRRIRPISALKAEAAKLLQERMFDQMDEDENDSSDDSSADDAAGYLKVGGALRGMQIPEHEADDAVPPLGSPGAPLPTTLPGTETTPGMLNAQLDSVDQQLAQIALLQQQEEMQRQHALAAEANARAHSLYLAAQEEARRQKAELEEAERLAAQQQADQKKKAAQEEDEKMRKAAAEQEEAEQKKKAKEDGAIVLTTSNGMTVGFTMAVNPAINSGVIIEGIGAGGQAESVGGLSVGDVVTSVNGVDVTYMDAKGVGGMFILADWVAIKVKPGAAAPSTAKQGSSGGRDGKSGVKSGVPTMKPMPEWKRRAAERAAESQKRADEESARRKAAVEAERDRIHAEREAARTKAAEEEDAARQKSQADLARLKEATVTMQDRDQLFKIFEVCNTDGDTNLSAAELMDGLHKTDLQPILNHYGVVGEVLIKRLDKETGGEINVIKFINGIQRIVKEKMDEARAALQGGLDASSATGGGGAGNGNVGGGATGKGEGSKKKTREIKITSHAVTRSQTSTLGFKLEMRKPSSSLSGDPFIKAVDTGGASYGKLYSGDALLAINGKNVVGLKADDIGKLLLAGSGGDFMFVVAGSK